MIWQAELKAALTRSRYLLITAPTGYGKTREAGVLAQTMMQEQACFAYPHRLAGYAEDFTRRTWWELFAGVNSFG